MTISKFSFQDTLRGWKLNEVAFSDLNLLVGKSGVGKTRVLRAIRSVRRAATSSPNRVNGCSWNIEMEANGETYSWQAETSLVKAEQMALLEGLGGQNEEPDAESPRFLKEKIIKEGNEVVRRGTSEFIFNGQPLPKLKDTESAISLLKDEEQISPLYRSLSRFIFSEAPDIERLLFPFDIVQINRLKGKCQSLDSLREITGVPMLIKAYLLQEEYPGEFGRLKEQYLEIFETVSDIKIGKLSEIQPSALGDAPTFAEWMAIGIREKGVDDWIVNDQISSGMIRTLIHLTELALAPAGTVIMVDEFENSLGVNCLPQLTDVFLSRIDLQFILTSHHPYVINNIPWKYWKVVTRKGSEISVRSVSSFPGFDPNSLQSGFVQLASLDEYEEAIR